MLSESQKGYVFRLAMEAAQNRAMVGGNEDDSVGAAQTVVAAAKAALKALDDEDGVTVNVTINGINGKGVSINGK